MALNLTGTPSVWADLQLAQQNQDQLQEQQDQVRKRKLLGAGAPNGMMSAAQTLLGSRTIGSATSLV